MPTGNGREPSSSPPAPASAAPPPPSAGPPSTPRRERRWPTALFVLALAGGVWAALRMHEASHPAAPWLPSDGRYVDRPATGRLPSAVPFAQPEADLAATTLPALPADLVMPPGATRLALDHRRILGHEEIKAEYASPGEPMDLAEFLRDGLGRLGWRPAWEAPPGEPVRVVFHNAAGDTLYVRLNREGVCVTILAVIRRAVARPNQTSAGEGQ